MNIINSYRFGADDSFLTFQTNSPNSTTFDPVWVMVSGDLKWDLGDTTIFIGNTVSHTYADGTTKTIKVFANTTTGAIGVQQITMNADYIIGSLDFSEFVNLGGIVNVGVNALLTSLILPTSSQIFTQLIASFCNLSTINLSGLTGLGGILRLNDNISLSSISFPSSSQVFSEINLSDCAFTSLNLSSLTGLGGIILLSNSTLSSLTLPISSQIITQFIASSGIFTSLDISGLTGLGGSFDIEINLSLTSLTLPSTSQTFTSFNARFSRLGNIDFSPMPNMTDVNSCAIQLQSSAMSQSEVDYNLDQIDQISSGGFTGRTFNIAGNNAAPSAAGLASKTSLEGKGFTVTVST